MFKSTFGGKEVVSILERVPGAKIVGYEYRLLATKKTSTMQKELAEAGDQGYGFVGMTVAKTLVGGDEVGLLRTLVVHSDEPRAIRIPPANLEEVVWYLPLPSRFWTRRSMRIHHFSCAGMLACSVVLTAAAVQAQSFDIVASGLNNPRGLAFAPNGDLYVVEAGSGGTDACHVGPTGPRCFGLSGAVLRIDLGQGTTEVVVDGLPSLAAASGAAATGAHDLGFQGQGNLYFTIGFAGHPDLRASAIGEPGASLARVARLLPDGSLRLRADLGTYEVINDPDGDEPDSNPYGILVLPGRRIVADAGANALLEIRANGDIRTLAVFPEFQVPGGPSRDAVPTGLALGPDGAYYVGQLTGAPFGVGLANVYRVSPEGGEPEVHAGGFTNIIDLEFGPDGSLYVLQIANPIPNFGGGALIRVAPDGTRTPIDVPLTAPGGIAIAKDGTIYVTNNSTSPFGGEVLRIIP